MPLTNVSFDSFNRGELGPYMDGRSDLEIWRKSAQTIENFLVLPHGGVQMRRGTEFIMDITALDSAVMYNQVVPVAFSFNDDQEFLLLFRDDAVDIMNEDAVAVTITGTGISAANVENIRWAQSGDTMIVVEPNSGIFELKRQGSNTLWSWNALNFDTKPRFQFNQSQTITASASSVGSDRTFSLSGTDAYWKAAYANGIEIYDDATGVATIDDFTNQATGGTAYSGSGTAANAFDSNTGTACNAGVDGWIGYDFTTDTTIRILGINSNSTVTYTLECQTDDNSSFTSPTTVDTITVSCTAGTTTYVDVAYHTGEQFFRIVETGGETLDVKELVFNEGLVAQGDITTAWSGTGAITVWAEEVFGSHKGWARSVEFLNTRLWFGGVRDEPSLILGSKDGDVFNFDEGDATATDAMVFSPAYSNFVIYDLKAKRDGLVIFAAEGEWEIFSKADEGITPTAVNVRRQSNFGCENVPTIEVDGELFFVTGEGKQIRSFNYEFARDQYIANNKTDLAHHLFVDGKHPRNMALLKSYLDTQSSLVFVPREDGEMAVCSLDSSREVLAWSRWTTGSTGYFGRAAVVKSADRNNVEKDHLYVVVQRTIDDSTTKVYLEKLTEEERYLDSWVYGSSIVEKTAWNGATHLAGNTVQAVGDGLVLNDVTVQGSGAFTTDYGITEIYIGIGYTATLTTQPVTLYTTTVRGGRTIPKKAFVNLYETQHLKINDRAISFRNFDVDELGGTLTSFTGLKKIHISNIGTNVRRDPQLTLTVDQPLPATILTVSADVKITRKR